MRPMIRPVDAILLVTMAALAACQSAPPPSDMSRSTTEGAPTDLQLLCASAVAAAAKSDPGKTLPTSSAKMDDQSYLVDVAAAGKTYKCTIDTAGTVKSVQPAAS